VKRSVAFGLFAPCVLAACAQILGVGDFSDQTPAGAGGALDHGGSSANAGTPGEPAGGLGGSGSDITECTGDFECEGATLVQCLAGIRTEVDTCASDALCDARTGACLAAACETGEQRCNVATLERCNADLSDFDVVGECASAALCDENEDACLPPACDVEEYQCTGSVLEACSEDRSGFIEGLDCTTRELCDDANGQCLVAECMPGVYQCKDEALLRCEDSGRAIKVEATCATAALCNDTAGRCDPPVCDVNQYQCTDTELAVCNANRDGFDPSQSCATAALCNEGGGRCDPPACNAGQYQCQGKLLRVCNSGRTGFVTSKTCTAGEICLTSPAECQTYDEFLDGLDGLLYEAPCKSSSTDDCDVVGYRLDGGSITACVVGNNDAVVDHDVGGISGQTYDVTLHVYGIVEPKDYGPLVTREAGTTRPDVAANPSLPAPWATAPSGHLPRTSDYNTYEVRVSDPAGTEVAVYYLNSNYNDENHYTFALSYERTIAAIGGGTIRFRAFDDNCRIIKNCGTGGSPCVSKARSVDISAANPQPTALSQPGLGTDPGNSGQWLLIDVVSVAPR
jgi:hypothetical protein